MRSAVLIFNPAAGRHRAEALATLLTSILAARGWDAEPRATLGPGDATRIAREAARAGVDAIFVLGGDGTLREAAAGILGTPLALGFLPIGTANVMAFALGLPGRPLRAAQLADRLEAVTVDVGWCGAEPFLMMASAGLDGAALGAIRPTLKRRFGRVGVAVAGVEAWWRYGYPAIAVEAHGTRTEATLVVAANIPFYGGPLRIAPGAAFDDGQLDLILFRGRGRRAALAFARDLALGRHLRRSDTEHIQTDRLRLIAPEAFAAQIDGDPREAVAPLDIHIEPAALRLLRVDRGRPLARRGVPKPDAWGG